MCRASGIAVTRARSQTAQALADSCTVKLNAGASFVWRNKPPVSLLNQPAAQLTQYKSCPQRPTFSEQAKNRAHSLASTDSGLACASRQVSQAAP